MVTKIVKEGRIKVVENGVTVIKHPGDEIILSEKEADVLADKLLEPSDTKNLSKLAEEIASGQTISLAKHNDVLVEFQKKAEAQKASIIKEKNSVIEAKLEEIKKLQRDIESMKIETKRTLEDLAKEGSKKAADEFSEAEAEYEKKIAKLEGIVNSQNKEIDELQKTVDKQDKELKKLQKPSK